MNLSRASGPVAPCRGGLMAAAALVLLNVATAQAQPAVEGYRDYDSYAQRLTELAESDLVSLKSLGKTLGGRDVYVVTLSQGDPAGKPAWLVVGSTSAAHLVGSEVTVRMIEQIVDQADSDEALKKLLAEYALHFVPRPSPDASEHFFHRPASERSTNNRPTDEDRDGKLDEDGPEDLNGDGWITLMRVEDPTGTWMEHPAEPRILIQADAAKNERGRWLVYVEGIDNDGDEKWNEDGPGGVDFNRNFTFAYPYFEPGAGPHQVSEVETRAVADFAFDRLNIGLVFSFSPQDNLMQSWQPSKGSQERMKTTIRKDDQKYFDYIAGKFKQIRGGSGAPASEETAGAFAPWAYFHYGRWSLSSRGWWPPKLKDVKPAKSVAKSKPEHADGQKKKSNEKRGADQVAALAWLEREKIAGFVPWTKIEHPDFPGQTVEIGGFKPYLRTNPPAGQLDDLATQHVQFFAELAKLMPKIELGKPKVEKLGDGVFRLTVRVSNEGFLPTAAAMGRESRQVAPIQLQVDLPEGAKLLTGTARVHLAPLSGRGGSHEQTWLILPGGAESPSVTIKAWHPAVGADSTTVELQGKKIDD